MPASSEPDPPVQAEGIIQQVDPVNRELRVLVEGAVVSVDVPAGCPIFLNQERVRFRLLQPGDHIWLTFVCNRGRSVARRIEVRISRISQA